MGSVFNPPRHQQVSWSVALDQKKILPVLDATDQNKSQDEAGFLRVNKCKPQPGVNPDDQDISIYPMLSERVFINELQEFHKAFVKAIVDIVDRWWDDKIANFPSRMPLEPRAEDILKWIDKQSKNGSMSRIADCLGNWRPDFLLTHNEAPGSGQGFQICEINCRTPLNAVIHTAYKHDIMEDLLGSGSIIEPAGSSKTMVDGLLGHFDLGLPIHIVKGRDRLDRQEFIQLVELRTGLKPKLLDISELQLKPESSSSTGFALYCKLEGAQDTDVAERIHQVALALFPDEYSLLSPNMLRQLAMVSVNDIRVCLFLNDQRFLGIIKQELKSLSEKHEVLTTNQARILQDGIVDTILPGSPELEKIFKSNTLASGSLKDDFILKAARASRGNGHLLGDELSEDEWEANLLRMQDPTIRANTTSYVLQPYVRQPKFDIVVEKTRIRENSLMVGSYYATNGRFAGLGPWRTSNGKICNVYRGGCVLVNSITTADIWVKKWE